MSIVANVIAAVIKSVAGDNLGNGLIKELASISIDGVSEKSINEITKFINKERSKIDSILSKDNMRSMEISEENIGYVVAEIKDLLSKINITDEVLRQCKYDNMNLSAFLWNEYKECKNDYIECEREIKRCLFTVAEALIKLVYESENFEKDVLIYISNLVDDTNAGLQNISEYMEYNFDKLDADNRIVLEMQQKIIEEIQNAGTKDQYKKHKVKSRTQEYADKWNANMFLNDFDKRDENAGVNVKLSEVYLDEHLPHYIWGENKNERSDLKDLLEEYINEHNENKMLLILGQPGIGKSTLITWITANFENYRNNILVYQFASDLKNIDWINVNHEYDIANKLLEKLNLSYDILNGKTLIIDGFDEISTKNSREDILNEFYWQLIEDGSLHNFSLIITCRENYILNPYNISCSYITLEPWDIHQIQSFCGIYSEKIGCEITFKTKENILKNREILGIPLILYMVLALNISIEKESSIVDVYDRIFALDGGIYDRCIGYEKPHRIKEIKRQIHEVSKRISIWMFENNPDAIDIPQEEYQKICMNIMEKYKLENGHIMQDFLIGNYFKLVKHCEGVEAESLCFVHRTIYEYFVAEYIFGSMEKSLNVSKESLAGTFGCMLKGSRLSIKTLEFLKSKIRNSKINYLFDTVNETFQMMLQDGMTYYTGKRCKKVIDYEMTVFANMLEIIHLWENCHVKFDSRIYDYLKYNRHIDLNLKEAIINIEKNVLNKTMLNTTKGLYLRGVNLLGANLSRVELTNSDLVGANLIGADLTGACLIGADLTGACLIRANLIEADLRKAHLTGADLMRINLTGAKLNESIWHESDVQKILPELRSANFAYLIILESDETKKLQRSELFPNENSNE